MTLIDPENCWIWPGAVRQEDGRGRIGNRYAYRVIYEAVTGAAVPDDLVLHHECHTPGCVNPFHLSPVSRAEHLEEHRPLMKITCRNGHVLGGTNLYVWRGKRYCRACHKENQRRQRARKKESVA